LTLKQLLYGPTSVTNGTENFMLALRTAMGVCGAATLKDMQKVEMVIAPTIKTEGKYFQAIQGICT
jgi:IMP dehydrogenase